MSTLLEDIRALQERLSRELGLQFQIDIKAHTTEQEISKETALRVGEIAAEFTGGIIGVYGNCVHVETRDSGITFGLFYDEPAEKSAEKIA